MSGIAQLGGSLSVSLQARIGSAMSFGHVVSFPAVSVLARECVFDARFDLGFIFVLSYSDRLGNQLGSIPLSKFRSCSRGKHRHFLRFLGHV